MLLHLVTDLIIGFLALMLVLEYVRTPLAFLFVGEAVGITLLCIPEDDDSSQEYAPSSYCGFILGYVDFPWFWRKEHLIMTSISVVVLP